jgi:prepilin-type N-terminal cleavage/methylation domain-containing protein
MKITTQHTSRARAGFSLIELLVVISLIAMLASISIVGISAASKNARTKETGTRVKLIEGGLEAYKTEQGEYPQEVAWDRQAAMPKNGGSWPAGGGACLYQALFGDGTSEIAGFQAKNGESPGSSTGEYGSSGTPVYIKDLGGKKESYVVEAGGLHILIDGFAHPIAYRRYDKNQDAEFENEGTFDLWSYGTLDSPSNSDADKRLWITNFE